MGGAQPFLRILYKQSLVIPQGDKKCGQRNHPYIPLAVWLDWLVNTTNR